jgi:hypothetical protein
MVFGAKRALVRVVNTARIGYVTAQTATVQMAVLTTGVHLCVLVRAI